MLPLWNRGSSSFYEPNAEQDERLNNLPSLIAQHGLAVKLGADATHTIVEDHSVLFDQLGGDESASGLSTLSSWISSMRATAAAITRAQFRHKVTPFVQMDNRSVASHLRNMQMDTTVILLLDFLTAFIGKDIKHPLRTLEIKAVQTDYGQDDDLSYSEAETGTYHTLQRLGENSAWRVYSGYLEDSPLIRRYIRYIDFLASRFGMRLVYCPAGVASVDSIPTQPTRPSWSVVDDRVIRTVRDVQHTFLYVSLTFEYNMFSELTVVESSAQPGQRRADANSMDFTPVFVDNLEGIITVLKTLGSFALCKLYYKDFMTHRRSSPAVQSS